MRSAKRSLYSAFWVRSWWKYCGLLELMLFQGPLVGGVRPGAPAVGVARVQRMFAIVLDVEEPAVPGAAAQGEEVVRPGAVCGDRRIPVLRKTRDHDVVDQVIDV